MKNKYLYANNKSYDKKAFITKYFDCAIRSYKIGYPAEAKHFFDWIEVVLKIYGNSPVAA